MKDIRNRKDIEVLVRAFYEKLMVDENIGKFFTKKIIPDLEEHFPRLIDFWELTLFQQGGYSRNPMEVHKALHKKINLASDDFERWVFLFKKTVDEYFAGEYAELAKQRAQSIATVMQLKILYPGNI